MILLHFCPLFIYLFIESSVVHALVELLCYFLEAWGKHEGKSLFFADRLSVGETLHLGSQWRKAHDHPGDEPCWGKGVSQVKTGQGRRGGWPHSGGVWWLQDGGTAAWGRQGVWQVGLERLRGLVIGSPAQISGLKTMDKHEEFLCRIKVQSSRKLILTVIQKRSGLGRDAPLSRVCSLTISVWEKLNMFICTKILVTSYDRKSRILVVVWLS